MLVIKGISMKNFFSFGNVHENIDLNADEITLVLGLNNDAPKDDDTGERRNGVGKSSIIQGIVYSLYGKSIGNDIKIPNLVNKINTKNCEVFLNFSKDGVDYRIERGRNPTYFHFYKIDENGIKIDDSRGESKDTQEDLQQIIGIPQILFEYVVVMNSNVEPFLSLNAQKQRDIIESLLGITQLTEKAERLKEMYKENHKLAQQERFRLETLAESNKRIENSIEVLQNQAETFEKNKVQTILNLQNEIDTYESLDFDGLLELAKIMEDAIANNTKHNEISNRVDNIAKKCQAYEQTLQEQKNKILREIDILQKIDINMELSNHLLLENYNKTLQKRNELTITKRHNQQRITQCQYSIDSLKNRLQSEMDKLKSLNENECPLCKSNLECTDDDLINRITADIEKIQTELKCKNEELKVFLDDDSHVIIPECGIKPQTIYHTLSEAKLHEHKLQELINLSTIEHKNIYTDELLECYGELENTPYIEYEETISTSDIQALKFQHSSLVKQLEKEKDYINPYFNQIQTLKENSIKVVDYTEYNTISKLAEHQDFLVKLLLNKDSFVRKRIIEQNIQYLNTRLQYYIEKVGSLHTVEFVNDLSVNINLNWQTYDFKQLSRGERTRVVIALNLAFRDVLENVITPVNILVNDEIFDDGLDPHGVNTMWEVFKEYTERGNKSTFIVSHRDEVLSKAKKILLITKEDEFSSVEYTDVSSL